MILKKILVGIKITLLLLKKIINFPIKGLTGYLTLINNNYVTNFLHEGNITIRLPKISILNAALNPKKVLKRSVDFFSRPQTEVLLRKIIFSLYEQRYIDKKKSVIDIGCWIADNSLVWAKMLKEDGTVFAIDPSVDNQLFGKGLATLNNISNIKWVNAVCSDKQGIPLSYDGSIYMAEFKVATESDNLMVSTTLDHIVNEKIESIGFMHVDVEGFELKVLQGAKKIIELSRPVITFEQHISKENVDSIINFLQRYEYNVYMINEVLPGFDLDCRNFIAFDSKKKIPELDIISQKDGRLNGIFHAIIGHPLIKIA